MSSTDGSLGRTNVMNGMQRLYAIAILCALVLLTTAIVGSCLVAHRNSLKSEREWRACVIYHTPADCALGINQAG